MTHDAECLPEDDDSVIVTCCLCNTEFEGFSPGQASDCATDWDPDDRTLTGHYGSAVLDMEQWIVEDDTPLPEAAGQVCDSCLRKMIDAGVMIRANTHSALPMDPDPELADLIELEMKKLYAEDIA